jgi:hypothetical protein
MPLTTNCTSILPIKCLDYAYPKLPSCQFPYHSKEHVVTFKFKQIVKLDSLPKKKERKAKKWTGQFSPTRIVPMILREFVVLVPKEQTLIQLAKKHIMADDNDMGYTLREHLWFDSWSTLPEDLRSSLISGTFCPAHSGTSSIHTCSSSRSHDMFNFKFALD